MVQDFILTDYIKIFSVAILIYTIIYGLLTRLEFFGKDKKVINFTVAFISGMFLLFTGTVSYIVIYSINWFVIILIILFLVFVLASFFGIKNEEVRETFKDSKKIIIIVLLILFMMLFLKGCVSGDFQENKIDIVVDPDQDNIDTENLDIVDEDTTSKSKVSFSINYGIIIFIIFFLVLIGGIIFLN